MKNKENKSKNTDHIIINTKVRPAIQECLRCGKTAPMPFGELLTYANDLLNAFIKAHRHRVVRK